jgi:hypothetical protein
VRQVRGAGVGGRRGRDARDAGRGHVCRVEHGGMGGGLAQHDGQLHGVHTSHVPTHSPAHSTRG